MFTLHQEEHFLRWWHAGSRGQTWAAHLHEVLWLPALPPLTVGKAVSMTAPTKLMECTRPAL